MTIALRRPRPRLNFARIPRRRFEEHCAALEQQRDRAKCETRALRDWVTSWLEQRADAHQLDADHAATPEARRVAHRMTADDLRQLAIDLEEGPDA